MKHFSLKIGFSESELIGLLEEYDFMGEGSAPEGL